MAAPESERDATESEEATDGADDADGVRPTDIVFDCPHCGHNLCIDLRGAGLLTNCTECRREVLVPIPEGMNVGDLDLTSELSLGQLFFARRALAQAEQRIAELEEIVSSLRDHHSTMEKSRLTTLHHGAELTTLCQSIQRCQGDMAAALHRMAELIAAAQQH